MTEFLNEWARASALAEIIGILGGALICAYFFFKEKIDDFIFNRKNEKKLAKQREEILKNIPENTKSIFDEN